MISNRRFLTALVIVCFSVLFVGPLAAVDIPANAASTATIQTTGPNAGLNIGDAYTNANGTAPIPGGHEVGVYVPCTWPAATPITFAIYDPESTLPNPVGLAAVDEIRNANDNTFFTLTAPGGATVGPVTYTPAGGTNGLWVELSTVNTAAAGFGCGEYVLRTTTSDNDDNAWRLRVANDPDCSVSPGTCSGIGAPQSTLLNNGNQNDNPDGIAGTGDELYLGGRTLSYQNGGAGTTCQDFYEFVSAPAYPATVTFHNFDMDGNGNITYFPPAGAPLGGAQVGTVSGPSAWNGSPANAANTPNPPRTGDNITINAGDAGWWRVRVCAPASNQYIYEGQANVPLFFAQPGTPVMVVSKDNGVTNTAPGAVNTYVIRFTNTSNATATPGAATNVTLVDTLPANGSYVGGSCQVDAPFTGTCTPGAGTVTFNINGLVNAGATGTVRYNLQVNAGATGTVSNGVQLTFQDTLGNAFPPLSAVDVDVVGAAPPATPVPTVVAAGAPAFSDPFLTKSVNPPFAVPGELVTWTLFVSNPGSLPTSNVVVTDTMPPEVDILNVSATSGTTSVSGQTVTYTESSLAAGASATITINTRVRASAVVPFIIQNNATLNGVVAGRAVVSSASARVISVGSLPATGQSPWSALRMPAFALVTLAGWAAAAWMLRRS